MTNDDLVALAGECGARITRYEAYTEVRFDGESILATFAARLRAAPAAQGAGDERHGWVTPRADGAKARCGGPGLCKVCQREQATLAQPAGQPEPPCKSCGKEVVDGKVRCVQGRMCEVGQRTQAEQAQGVSESWAVEFWRLAQRWYRADAGEDSSVAGDRLEDYVRTLSHSAPASPPVPPDMRAVCEALGFDPTNHHNAAKCPYCRPASPPVPQVPPPMTPVQVEALANQAAREWGDATDIHPTIEVRAVMSGADARDAQWLAALGRQA